MLGASGVNLKEVKFAASDLAAIWIGPVPVRLAHPTPAAPSRVSEKCRVRFAHQRAANSERHASTDFRCKAG